MDTRQPHIAGQLDGPLPTASRPFGGKLEGGIRGNRVAVLTGVGRVEIEEREIPVPRGAEVLIEVSAVGVCGSDVHYFTHGRIGPYIVEEPLVLGHEAAGVVVGLGSAVTSHQLGDRVTIEPGVPCGRCSECRTGRYNLCPRVRFLATPPVDGAFARYVAIHEDFVFSLPPQLSDEEGALIEPLSVAVWACTKGGVTAGSRVLVTGAGPIGLLTTQAARAFGAVSVEVAETDPHRREVARRVGATQALDGEEVPGQADVLIECSGSAAALATGIEALRPGGTAVVVGMSSALTQELPLATIQNRELWVTGTFRYANTYPTAIALARTEAIDLAGLITDRFPLDEAQQALESAREPTTTKAIVLP